MTSPLLYEINTRCWLRELADKRGQPVTLADVPVEHFVQWKQAGFTHVWLMGVWTSGPRARAQALANPAQCQAYVQALPDWKEADTDASPYSISDYTVPAALGGEAGLKEFRRELHQHGLKLVLDFVPNHLGVDHAWVSRRPALFVQKQTQAPGTFLQETADGPRWLAHGKDPNFPAWSDTVQLDYRRADTRAAMTELLASVVKRCDGVRCDMAMLLLNDVFTRTWEHIPVTGGPAPGQEFWSSAITAARKERADCLFLAEVYWGLEPRLQALGFDYTYDKTLYDQLLARDSAGVQRHLLGLSQDGLPRWAHFLENHDEPRVASVLQLPEHRAAALVILGLPGLRFLHEGQLSGARVRTPVQLLRRQSEPEQPDVRQMYQQLLSTLASSTVGHGTGRLLAPRSAWPGNSSGENFVVVQWQAQPPEFDLAVVNLAPHRSQCYAPLSISSLSARNWTMKDLLGPEQFVRSGDDLQAQGLYLDLPPHGAQLFHFQPAA